MNPVFLRDSRERGRYIDSPWRGRERSRLLFQTGEVVGRYIDSPWRGREPQCRLMLRKRQSRVDI